MSFPQLAAQIRGPVVTHSAILSPHKAGAQSHNDTQLSTVGPSLDLHPYSAQGWVGGDAGTDPLLSGTPTPPPVSQPGA